MPTSKVIALRFTKRARARIEKSEGKCLSLHFNQLAVKHSATPLLYYIAIPSILSFSKSNLSYLFVGDNVLKLLHFHFIDGSEIRIVSIKNKGKEKENKTMMMIRIVCLEEDDWRA